MLNVKLRLGLMAILFLVIIQSGCTADIKSENVEHSSDTIDELNTILGKLDDESAKKTIQELINSPAEIEKSYLTVNGTRKMRYTYNKEVAPFKRQPFSYLQLECILEVGDYIRYGSIYNEECKNGNVKVHYLTVFVEVDEENELMLPLYLYAYNRVIEKRTGMLETFTEPDFHNSFIEIGSKH